MRKTEERLAEAREIIESKQILDMNFHGGELCFYIFDYPARDEIAVREFVKLLVREYGYEGAEYKILELDLYSLMIEILESEKVGSTTILDMLPDMEKKSGTDRMEKALKAVLNPDRFVSLIEEKFADHNLVFITGIGKVYPIIRSHAVLNNLHSTLDKVPVIMFYPGIYDQKELSLFGESKDDNYYRAFRLVED